MALRIARGLFRIWLALSVIWLAGVGFVTWVELPSADSWAVQKEVERLDMEMERQNIEIPRWGNHERAHKAVLYEHLWDAPVFAIAPPAFLLALGSALIWAFRGFR